MGKYLFKTIVTVKEEDFKKHQAPCVAVCDKMIIERNVSQALNSYVEWLNSRGDVTISKISLIDKKPMYGGEEKHPVQTGYIIDGKSCIETSTGKSECPVEVWVEILKVEYINYEVENMKELKIIKDFMWKMEDGYTDDTCEKCDIMTILLEYHDGEIYSIGDIEMGLGSSDEYIKEVCERIIQNHGFYIIDKIENHRVILDYDYFKVEQVNDRYFYSSEPDDETFEVELIASLTYTILDDDDEVQKKIDEYNIIYSSFDVSGEDVTDDYIHHYWFKII